MTFLTWILSRRFIPHQTQNPVWAWFLHPSLPSQAHAVYDADSFSSYALLPLWYADFTSISAVKTLRWKVRSLERWSVCSGWCKISFEKVCCRETIRAALLTGVHAASQLWLSIEPKGSFNLGATTLRVNKHEPHTQRQSAIHNVFSMQQSFERIVHFMWAFSSQYVRNHSVKVQFASPPVGFVKSKKSLVFLFWSKWFSPLLILNSSAFS